MRHPHADLIHAWAEGAEIEVKHSGKWITLTLDIPPYQLTREYRIKPKKPEWYDDIPEHGVLCWVKDLQQTESTIDVIVSSAGGVFKSRNDFWDKATPLN